MSLLTLLAAVGLAISSRARYEVVAFRRMWHPHAQNSTLRKRMTMTILYLWCIYTLLLAVQVAVETWVYWPMTAVIMYILGRQHEAEFLRLVGIDPSRLKDDSEDD